MEENNEGRLFGVKYDLKEVKALLSFWEKYNMDLPAYVAIFGGGKKDYCMKYNHRSGYGCSADSCKRVHRCFICDSDRHGAFYREENEKYSCRKNEAIHNKYSDMWDEADTVLEIATAAAFEQKKK